MEMELKRGSELLFFLGKWGDSETLLWQAKSHNPVDTRVLPHAHHLGLVSQTQGSETGGVGTSGKHSLGQPHHGGGAVPTRHPAPGSCSRLSRGHLGCMRPSRKLLQQGWSSSMANQDTEEHGEGGRSGKNRGNIRPFFTKASAYLLLTTGCMSLFIHICKWLVEDKIIVFFLTFEHLVFSKYQSVVYFSQKLFLMSQGTRQIGCKTARTGMSQAECKLRICCTGLVVL